MKRWLELGFVVCAGVLGAGAQGTARQLQFSLDRPGPPPVQYTISLSEDGSGIYAPRIAATLLPASTVPDGGKSLRIEPTLVKKLFAAVPMVEGGRCETHSKGIARTGTKTLHYAGAGRDAQCTYNYSDDDRVNDATNAFEAIAQTMEYGQRLAAKLRFDRLGLDSELDGLQSAVTDGRALEVGNIAPVLKTISEDERVMDRVRRKAIRLLEGVPADQTVAGVGSSDR